jgi:hypothetical protein
VQEDRDLGVAQADLGDEGTQLGDGLLLLVGQLLVVDGQDEGRGAALLLGEGGQVAIAGDAEHLHALGLDGLGQARMPRPEAFSERKSSSMMMTGKLKRMLDS